MHASKQMFYTVPLIHALMQLTGRGEATGEGGWSRAPNKFPVLPGAPHTHKIVLNVKLRNGQRKTCAPTEKQARGAHPPPPPKTLATPLLIHDSEILMPRSHLPVKSFSRNRVRRGYLVAVTGVYVTLKNT